MTNYNRDFLISEHMNLAKEIAYREWKTATHALDKDEMLSLAYLGLVDAATRWEAYCAKNEYDPTATQYFKVFARLRIRGTIRDKIRSEDWATRTLRSKSTRLKAAGQDEGVSIAELAERTGMSTSEINKVNARLAAKPVSLDAKMSTGDFDSASNEVQLKEDIDTEGIAFANSMINTFVSTLKTMSPESQVVIVLHYYSKLDLRKVAEELNLPETKVSQIHSNAIVAVREALMDAAQERG